MSKKINATQEMGIAISDFCRGEGEGEGEVQRCIKE